jgi:ABC-type transporter Mla MlaB component
MLKITTHDESYQVTLKLEGSVAGTWVTELEDSWRAVSPTLDGRPLRVHLTQVGHVDNAGRYLLALLRYRGVLLAADGIVMTELVRTIEEDWPSDPKQTPPREKKNADGTDVTRKREVDHVSVSI